MVSNKLVHSLQHEKIFAELPEGDLRTILENSNSKVRRKGQILFFENDEVSGLHFIQKGKVKLYKTSEEGDLQLLKIAQAGELIGYRGLLGDGRYIATAEAIEDIEIVIIPKGILFAILKSNPNFSLGMMQKFANDLSEIENRTARFLKKDSKARLADALLLLQQKFGTDGFGFIAINLSRKDIASLTGVVSETIIRILKSWEQEGIILLHKRLIKIVSIKELMNVSKTG